MITIDVKTTLICLVLVILALLLIYLIVVAKNLVTTLQKVNKVLDDVQVISAVTSDKVSQVDGIVGDLSGAFGDVASAVKGNHNLVGAVTNMGKAVASTVSYFKNSDEDPMYYEEEMRKQKKREQ